MTLIWSLVVALIVVIAFKRLTVFLIYVAYAALCAYMAFFLVLKAFFKQAFSGNEIIEPWLIDYKTGEKKK